MKRLGLACASLLVASSAYAQQPPAPPPFEPYVVTQEQHQSLLEFLYKQVPGQYADPIRNALMQFEQNAQQQKQARAKPVEQPKKEGEVNTSTPPKLAPKAPLPPKSPIPSKLPEKR
jgi:hypothetical protein